ncbi:nucleotidyltransferase domain-containing protein [Geotoga petraea]|jgi:predicted nucleotidyltransferase|uniref:Nucleotidyltransferase domain-containing protein n=1 Tax=Geotoga petraea TaxID=28234 RepID=A0A1G6L2A0_9BACT|nr:nucleotidyltransferase domain-containing protein [Geotoga petraea]SDC37499.1 hypothetical protein SAMN04488588_0985 [Geotoga petraea]
MKEKPIEAAKKFVEYYFPKAQAAMLAGSVARQEYNDNSDLNIIVITDEVDTPYRQSYAEFGWNIEAFVFNNKNYMDFFEKDARRKRPSLPNMILESIILKDNQIINIMKKQAKSLLKKGPEELTLDEIRDFRYEITNLLDDFEGEEDYFKNLFTVSELIEKLKQFTLLVNGYWDSKGKYNAKALKNFDEQIADIFLMAMEEYYKNENKDVLISLTNDILNIKGGKLFEGYRKG